MKTNNKLCEIKWIYILRPAETPQEEAVSKHLHDVPQNHKTAAR